MKEATNIILHSESLTAVNCLTDEQAGILFKAILEYAYSKKVWKSKDTALQALFSMIKTQIDRDWTKYNERCEKNRLNALKRHAKGGGPMPREPVASDGKLAQANESNNNRNNNSKNNDDIANAININIESNPSEIQSNGTNNYPRIDKQEKRKRDVLSAATNVIERFSSTSK